jgi:hypothetical protein
MVHVCHPSKYRKHKIGESLSRLAWAKSETPPNSKIIRKKRAGNMDQMLECLPSKHKALSLNPPKRERMRHKRLISYIVPFL